VRGKPNSGGPPQVPVAVVPVAELIVVLLLPLLTAALATKFAETPR